MVFYPLNAWLIASLGWRTALAVFGGLVAAATVSLALLYREPPPPHRPAGGAAFTSSRGARASREVWTLRRALRSVRLWSAFTMTALGVIGFQIMATHQVAHAIDRGRPAGHRGLALRLRRRVHDGGQRRSAAGSRIGPGAGGSSWPARPSRSSGSCASPRSEVPGPHSPPDLRPVRIRLRHANRPALHDSRRRLRRPAPGRDPRGGPGGGRPGRRDRSLPRRLALRRHQQLSAGVPGRLVSRSRARPSRRGSRQTGDGPRHRPSAGAEASSRKSWRPWLWFFGRE